MEYIRTLSKNQLFRITRLLNKKFRRIDSGYNGYTKWITPYNFNIFQGTNNYFEADYKNEGYRLDPLDIESIINQLEKDPNKLRKSTAVKQLERLLDVKAEYNISFFGVWIFSTTKQKYTGYPSVIAFNNPLNLLCLSDSATDETFEIHYSGEKTPRSMQTIDDVKKTLKEKHISKVFNTKKT